MSQVLNYMWALLSLGALVHWLCRSSHCKFPRRLQLFGLICALALLFPVISDNDDLLQQELFSTPVSPVLKILLNVKMACENSTTPVDSACRALLPSRTVQKFIARELEVSIAAPLLGATGGRSPPRPS